MLFYMLTGGSDLKRLLSKPVVRLLSQYIEILLGMSLPGFEDTLKFLLELAEEEKLAMSIGQTLRGAIISFAGAVVGGVTMGPLGIPFGAAAGGTFAIATGEKFTPLAKIIYEMPSEEKQKLVEKTWSIMMKHGVLTFVAVSATTAIRSEMVEMLKSSS
ncbi:hypothetical protein JTE90_021441 [Oedothorax gibbosus]|uniref:DUF697 domain-containing protein n=1 Tax=Oedothorax gibbosus TaxID=931172 RepID=A0AAV6VWL6_9ARAC|nr:hypothetical protein JTE90_021441 [Oedothorax gibbosus]